MSDDTSKFLQPVDDGLPMSDWGQWSKKDKLNILAHYIDTTTVAMKNAAWRRRVYIDLQAGPGKSYVRDQKSVVFLGSPLLALTRGAGYTDYRFVENDDALAQALYQRCQAHPQRNNIKVTKGNCNEVVSEIVAEIKEIDRWPPYSNTNKSCLSLAFLDPMGLELEWTTVQQLGSLNRADLIINFSLLGLKLNARQALKAPNSSIGETVDRFFGTPVWREIKYKSTRTPAHEWIEFYTQNLSKLGYLIGTPKSVKNDHGGELYRLLFASKHEKGIYFWEEALKGGPPQLLLPGM